MLGLIFLFFIGKNFYTLADKHNKSKWGYAILSIATFYGSQIFFGVLIGLYGLLTENYNILENNELPINLLAIAFALLCIVGLYYLLKNAWSKKKKKSSLNLLDDQFNELS